MSPAPGAGRAGAPGARPSNLAAELVDQAEPARLALVAIAREGERSELSFGELADRSARMAGALLARGVRRGDVVVTLAGNTPEWVFAMLACWRIGAVAQPCSEQLRPADLHARIAAVGPSALVADRRNLDTVAAAGFDGPVIALPDPALLDGFEPAPAVEVAPSDPALIVFTSGSAGEPKPIRHGHGYLAGQRVQAEHWYGARPATCAGAPPRADGRSLRATLSSPPGCAAPRPCCTTPASTRPSGSPWSSASG